MIDRQHRRVVPTQCHRSVGTAHLPAAADTEARSVLAGVALSAGHHAEDDGQRGDVLCPAVSVHFHLQVMSFFFVIFLLPFRKLS
jgi:hypothetical protein